MVSPDGSRVYVTGHDGSISIIDAVDYTVTTVSRDASAAEVISPEDNNVYLAHNQGRNCWVGLDDAPLDVAVSPGGDQLYVTNLHSLALIDTATKVVESVPAGDLPRHLHISGDGKQAYVTDFRHNSVWVLDTVNKAIITTVDLGRNPEALALSADEEFLYVADYLTPTLTVFSLASSKRRPNRAG